MQFMAAVANNYLIYLHVLAMSMALSYGGWTSMNAHGQLSCVYLMSTLDVTNMIKCLRQDILGTRLC